MDSEDFDDNMHQRGEGTPYVHDKPSLSKGSNAYLNPSRRCCNCKQSRCIKLYCECFAAGVYCNPTCNCVDCWNNPKYEDHRKAAIKSTLEKNPGAFQPKISSQNLMEQKILEHGKHSKGCACKKSSCMKKYCECFQAQIPCSDLCKCIDCHNTKEYYDANKIQSVGSDIGKPEELADSNSFFFKFLLAAGEPDSPGKTMKIPTLNKRLSSSLSQEALERLYEKLMKIINQPLDEYLDNEEYVKEIQTYNEESIVIPEKRENKDLREGLSQNTNRETEIEKLTVDKNNKEEAKEASPEGHDDLICDEEVEELVLKPASQQEAENKTQTGKEKQMEVEYEKDDKEADPNENSQREKKLSLYKIKKTRILREFISVLRELDT